MLTKPGILSAEDVSINDVPLNTIDSNSVAWMITDLEGWWGLPDVEIPDDPRPFSQDGSYYTTGRFTARTINLKGYILPVDGVANKAVASRNAFNRALILVRQRAQLKVREEGIVKTAQVQISSRPLLRISRSTGLLEFDITLRATDPVKYGEFFVGYEVGLAKAASGRSYDRAFDYSYGGLGENNTVVVMNHGSYPTKPQFTIGGPVENPMIEHIESGKFLKIGGMVELGSPITIDVATRQVLGAAENRRNLLVPSSRWFDMEPGANTIRFTGIGSTETHDAFSAQTNKAVNPATLESGSQAIKVESNITNLFPNPHPVSFTGIGWGEAPDADTDFTWIEDEPGPNQLLKFPRATVVNPGTEPTFLQGWTGSAPFPGGVSGQQMGVYLYYRMSHNLPIRMTLTYYLGTTLVNGANASFTSTAGEWDRVWAITTASGAFDSVSWRISIADSQNLPAGGTFDLANIMLLNTGTVVKTYFDPRPPVTGATSTPRSIEPYFTGAVNNSPSSFRKVARGWDTSTEIDNDFQIFNNTAVVRRPGTQSVEVRKDWSVSNFNNKKRLAYVTNIGAATSASADQINIYPGERNYVSVYAKCDVPDLYFVGQMRYYDVSGSLLITKTSNPTDMASGEWRRLMMWDAEGAPAPVNATKIIFSVEIWTRDASWEKKTSSAYFQDAKMGHIVYRDEGYFDGSFSFAEWTGFPHNSESEIPDDVPASQRPELYINTRDAWIE